MNRLCRYVENPWNLFAWRSRATKRVWCHAWGLPGAYAGRVVPGGCTQLGGNEGIGTPTILPFADFAPDPQRTCRKPIHLVKIECEVSSRAGYQEHRARAVFLMPNVCTD